jgi:hypothetical protein
MTMPEADPTRARIRQAITVTDFNPAPLRPLFEPDGRRLRVPMPELIAAVERKLAVGFPPWLREVYLCCNGFLGPSGECVLYPLDGSEGVGDFTLFLRGQAWSPPWLKRAVVFGHIRGDGSLTTHSVALDGQLAEWCYLHGDRFTVLAGSLFELWRQIQADWEEAVG